METNQAFDQSAFYAAIKKLLEKKGYLSSVEAASPEEWSLVHNASWTAYAANVMSLPGHPIPHNYESIPLQLLEDPLFVMEGAPDLSDIASEVEAEDTTKSAANPDDLEEDTGAGETANSNGTTGNSFKVDTGPDLPYTAPVTPVTEPAQAPSEPADSGAAPSVPAEGNHVEGGATEDKE